MGDAPVWHAQAVEKLSQLFVKEPEAKAFVLTGSLAAAKAQVDSWSDVDAKVILVLQMIWRDQAKQTTIHRTGGWGNELVTRFSWNSQEGSGEKILDLVRLSCEVFDELASELLPGYNQRGPLLFPTIEAAK